MLLLPEACPSTGEHRMPAANSTPGGSSMLVIFAIMRNWSGMWSTWTGMLTNTSPTSRAPCLTRDRSAWMACWMKQPCFSRKFSGREMPGGSLPPWRERTNRCFTGEFLCRGMTMGNHGRFRKQFLLLKNGHLDGHSIWRHALHHTSGWKTSFARFSA